ncbi:MAG TPA: glycosyltransferase [Lacipirellulaceae bacterium]|nr:glycosyltransferase [Lacipirellulaceae bacterium]HMP05974.1 glycosyltransferase [Lacipirellulaceae bacterium]
MGGVWEPVHHGLNINSYSATLSVPADAPIVHLGRLGARKGTREAVDVCQLIGRPLVLAGTVADEEKRWFSTEILSRCDGGNVRYIGPVTDREKQDLLGSAGALLLPIEFPEAFGLVAIEALACGCPVIAYSRYSMPEIVTHGVNGFLATTRKELIDAVQRTSEIDRRQCRRSFEQCFTVSHMAQRYLNLYNRGIGRNRVKGYGYA